MRFFAAIIIFTYGGLALLGVAALPHMAHGDCPFTASSGDCALLASPFGVIDHINGFLLTILVLPVFLALFFIALSLGAFSDILPDILSRFKRGCAENVFLPPRQVFYRWLSLVSSHS